MKFQYDDQPTIQETVLQAMGFASVCWTTPENAGTFESRLAADAGEAAIAAVRHIITFELSRLLDNTGTAKEWNAAIETAMTRIEDLR